MNYRERILELLKYGINISMVSVLEYFKKWIYYIFLYMWYKIKYQ